MSNPPPSGGGEWDPSQARVGHFHLDEIGTVQILEVLARVVSHSTHCDGLQLLSGWHGQLSAQQQPGQVPWCDDPLKLPLRGRSVGDVQELTGRHFVGGSRLVLGVVSFVGLRRMIRAKKDQASQDSDKQAAGDS